MVSVCLSVHYRTTDLGQSVPQSVLLGCHRDGSDGGKRREDVKTIGNERMLLLFGIFFSREPISIDIDTDLL